MNQLAKASCVNLPTSDVPLVFVSQTPAEQQSRNPMGIHKETVAEELSSLRTTAKRIFVRTLGIMLGR